MRSKTPITLAAILACAAATTYGATRATADTPAPGEFTTDTAAFAGANLKKMGLTYFPIRIALSTTKPSDVVKTPEFKGTARYGTFQLGNGPNGTYLVAIDDPDGGGGKLYVDANRNGNLTDDGDGAWAEETVRDGIVSYGVTSKVLKASYGTGGKETGSAPYAVGIYYRQGMDAAFYFRHSARVGTVTIGGKPFKAMLFDNDSDGIFNKPLPGPNVEPAKRGRPISLMVDIKNTGEFGPACPTFDIRGPFRIDGQVYEAVVSADGSRVAVKPSDKKLPEPPQPAPRPQMIAEGAVAPDFTVDTPGGGKVSLSSLRGKVVVLDFWATWCGPCLASMPHLEQVYQTLKGRDDVTVLAVCTSDERTAFDKWVQANVGTKYNFPVAYDPAGRGPKNISSSKYGVSGIPQTFIIGPDGKIVASITGYDSRGDHRLEEGLKKAGIPIEPVGAIAGPGTTATR
jgi:Thiol-disulfide isomerase and thioredoxins